MISLKSKITQKILNLLILNENGRFYVNELAKIINEYPAYINKKYKFLKEYKNIILKGVGFEKILKEKLKQIKGIESAYIFGSYAKNKLSEESDIDILVVGSFKTTELQRALLEVQKLAGREINSIELLNNEFKKKIEEKDELLIDIFSKDHIKII